MNIAAKQHTTSRRLTRPFKKIKPFFNRLQWKLTLAYTAFTVVTIFILGGLAIAFLWYLNFHSHSLPSRIADGLQRAAPAIANYLSPVDQPGLANWVDSVMQDNDLVIQIRREHATDDSDTFPAQFGRVKLLLIADASGQVLAGFPVDDAPAGASIQTLVDAASVGYIEAALRSETDADRLSTRDVDGNMVAAAPIFDKQQQLVGAVFLVSQIPFTQMEYVREVVQGTILPVALVMAVVGVLIGLIFGYLIARGLTRRLKRLTQTTDQWSQGDFSRLAVDTSGDEVGQLARHMNHMAIQLQNLLQTRQELAMLEERNRLARDLHDSVKQQVFATAMQIGATKALITQDPQTAESHLLEAEQLIKQSQQELTGLIKELRPAALEGKGLAQALQDYTLNWSRRTGIATEVRVRGERPLPLTMEQTLFRVAQEGLANVARHSQATHVDIDLAWRDDSLTMTIADNGHGFDMAAPNGQGVGLKSMSERMTSLGGNLSVESRPRHGTSVTATVAHLT